MYQEEIKIPKERIAILIGKKGETKKEIETKTETKIIVSSKEGDVTIKGEDSLKVYKAAHVIKSIGRGFNPDIALNLLNKDFCLEIVNMKDFCRKTKNDLIRIKARIIGTKGKARRILESMTGCEISVYGKTVCIIGEVERAMLAREAVEKLLAGSTHSNIYKWLEKVKYQKSHEDLE